ncbi:fructose bisphosphate aldolase [Novosphingobium sp.]|uniref:fructose bisphosphate aldolase n=1 Tax=Novosphingobium sp. TaxID=1874826 RepID=UPI003D1221B8
MDHAEQTQKIAAGQGFIAALDQSGGSTPKALKAYGVADDAWSNDTEMYALIHAMRTRIITAPSFSSGKIIGAILFERTMDGQIDGQPVPSVLTAQGVVPFLKIDKGLEDEADGVQLMKPIPGLADLLARAKGLGVFGTKERSVINSANATGIAAIVKQQFAVAQEVLDAGLMPILEPETNIKSATRAECDALLTSEILAALNALPAGVKVMLKLSLPAVPGTYAPLIAHPAVLKVVALSGGYARAEACAELAKNPGIIASFSRALLDDLRVDMTDAQFDATLGTAIDEIYAGSTVKSAPVAA